MKVTFFIALMACTIGSMSHALSVKESDIAGKSDLVLVANLNVNGTKETILTDRSGFSLYTFNADSANVSKCGGGCLTEWPPMHVPVGATVLPPFGSIKGNDGQPQLTIDGLPLYHYLADKQPGNAFGVYPSWQAVVVAN